MTQNLHMNILIYSCGSFIMKKYIIIVLLILFIPIATFLYNNNTNIYKNNWNINLPSNIISTYEINNQGWFGDGESYEIFECDNVDTLDLINKKNEKFEETINSILNDLEVSDDYKPNFNNDYQYMYIYDQEDHNDYLGIVYMNHQL